MATVELTDQQVVDVVNQLSPEQQARLLRSLVARQWGRWAELSRFGEARIRSVAAARGRDWDAMTEDEREAFVDDLVHEDRECST
jgi:hypothetical protein